MRKVVPSQAHGRKPRQADQNLPQAVQESSTKTMTMLRIVISKLEQRLEILLRPSLPGLTGFETDKWDMILYFS